MRHSPTIKRTKLLSVKWLTTLGREDGISMVAALMAMMVGMFLAAAAWATANTETRMANNDRWSRVATQIAQSGVSDYVKRLSNDPNFWSACDRGGLGPTDNGLGTSAINDTIYGSAYDSAYGLTGGGHPSRRWLPWSAAGSAGDRTLDNQYTIDLIPNEGQTACGTTSEATAAQRLVNQQTGTFRIRVTGRAGPPVPPDVATADIEQWRASHWKRTSVVVEFRRAGFLDYVYFTDHEALDPAFITNVNGTWMDAIWGGTNADFSSCGTPDNYYRYTNGSFPGREGIERTTGRQCPNDRPVYNGEQVNGPVHTNDSFLVESFSGATAPLYGNANKGDRIEVYDNGQSGAACGTNARFGGCACPFRTMANRWGSSTAFSSRTCSTTQRINAGVQLITGPDAGYIDMPTGNEELMTWAGDPAPTGSLYTGRTTITLRDDGKYDVVNSASGVTATGIPYPANGVIYVRNDPSAGSCESNTDNMYTDPALPGGMKPGCALTEVQGTYNKSLTIGSQGDIVALGDIKRAAGTTALLGLVANNYVRVRHYSTGAGDNNYLKKCVTPKTWFLFWWPDPIAHARCMNASPSADSIIQGIFDFFKNLFDSSPLVGYTCDRESSPVSHAAVKRIDAAILALRRSFLVDSANCGNQIGSAADPLVISGAMTQSWRGPITGQDWKHIYASICAGDGRPTSGWFAQLMYDMNKWFVDTVMGFCTNSSHGYAAKQFNYDYLLRALSPPHFLKPTESSWRINRIRETVPACGCGPTGATGP